MAVTVRPAAREDAPTVLRLIAALANFEELAPPDAEAQARFVRDGWPDDGHAPRFTAWLAEVETDGGVEAVGYAVTFETYSSFLARPTLYLEDLFVLTEHRRAGVGNALMERLTGYARERGCGRFEWVVLDWNTNAQAFYQRLGARHLTEWQTYRLEILW